VLVLQLVATLVLVTLASDAFTNAVEWLGVRLNLTRSAAGSIVAAIGSSLPESIIAVVALLILRDQRSQQIGIGAVLGAPFMLGTAVFCLIGLIALARDRKGGRVQLSAPFQPTMFGMNLFFGTFALALAASFVRSFALHAAAAVAVLCAYVVYLRYHLRAEQQEAEPSPPRLRLAPRSPQPPMVAVVLQLILALGVTIFASRWFIVTVGHAATALALAPFVVSVILSPIATELPEASNVVIWMRRREDSLALANVLGAMMFQTSMTCALAMLVTPWQLSPNAYAAGGAVLLAVAFVIVSMFVRRKVEPFAFAIAGLFYVGYLAIAARLLY
jgi:cation:H+ antiporter